MQRIFETRFGWVFPVSRFVDARGREWRAAVERVRELDEAAAEVMEGYVFLLRQESGRRRMEIRELRSELERRAS